MEWDEFAVFVFVFSVFSLKAGHRLQEVAKSYKYRGRNRQFPMFEI